MISSACSDLACLHVNSELHSLDHLRRFWKLKYLSFTGSSKSSPKQTLRFLRSLRSLDSIWIRGHFLGWVNGNLGMCFSLTPYVLTRIHPLKYYRSERFSLPIVKALRAHSQSLQSLYLEARWENFHVNKELIIELTDFISTSPIPDIDIAFNVPKDLISVDFGSFLPANDSRIDLFLHVDQNPDPFLRVKQYLALRASRYFSSTETITQRQTMRTAGFLPTTGT